MMTTSPRHARSGGRGAEAAAGTGRMPAEIVVRTVFAGAFQNASGEVIARKQAHESLAPADATMPREGQDDRDRDDAGITAAAEVVCVVEGLSLLDGLAVVGARDPQRSIA